MRGAARGGVVGRQPLNDFDAVSVRIGDEEPVRARNRRRLLNRDSAGLTRSTGGGTICDAQSEVPRTESVRPLLQQQVELRVAELEPEDLEVKRPRLGDLS